MHLRSSCAFVVMLAANFLHAQPPAIGAQRPAVPPQAGSTTGWTQSVGENGYRVAAIRGLPLPVSGMAITCERSVPVLGMNLGRLPLQVVTVGFVTPGGRAEIDLVPAGTNGHWAASVRDTRVLDLLSGSDAEAQVTIAGRAAGTIPLAGSSVAIGQALSGCYRRAAASSGSQIKPSASIVQRNAAATGSLAGAEQFVDNLFRLIANPSQSDVTALFTPEYKELEDRWNEAFAQSGEEGEPMDPLCESVACEGVRLVSRSVRALPGERAEALVRYDFPEFQADSVSSYKLILERTPAGWLIADIIYSDGSRIAFLRQDIAAMEGRSKRR